MISRLALILRFHHEHLVVLLTEYIGALITLMLLLSPSWYIQVALFCLRRPSILAVATVTASEGLPWRVG